MEELVAEIGAAFLCADLGVTPETRNGAFPDEPRQFAAALKRIADVIDPLPDRECGE